MSYDRCRISHIRTFLRLIDTLILTWFDAGTGDFSKQILVPWRKRLPKKVTKGDKLRKRVFDMKTRLNNIMGSPWEDKLEDNHYDPRRSILKLMENVEKKRL